MSQSRPTRLVPLATRKTPSIPTLINEWSPLQTTGFLVDGLGLAVVPLRGIHDDQAERPGKQPLLKNYRKLRPDDCDTDFRSMYWSPGSNYNVGVIIQEPFVWLDFDAKQDEGESAREWLALHPGFAGYPRVATRNGFHIPLIVRDLPPAGKRQQSYQVNDRLIIELLAPGNPVTVPPSLRTDGKPYTWEVTGDIPEFTWGTLCAALDIQTGRKPAKPSVKRGADAPQFKGDLTTLDLPRVLRDQGLLGECLDEESGKWSVVCPWQHEHSGNKDGADSSTVVFAPTGQVPGFKCQHAHCAERGILDLCRWLDERNPGVIDAGCAKRRIYDQGETQTGGGLPLVRHPGPGRLISEAAGELGTIIGPNEKWFARNNLIMELVRDKKDGAFRFSEVLAIGACAGVEMFVVPVVQPAKGEESGQLVPKSFDRETMGKLLAAPQFRERLPRIQRILNVPLAVIGQDGSLADLGPGYNPELELFVDGDAGGIPEVGTDEAKRVIGDLLAEFCFEGDQDRVHAIARLITPYVRPVMGWTARTPLWLFLANRPRAGKDYLAMLALIVHGGDASEDAPLERGSEETRKRITAALMSGRRFMHFANCQGHVDDAVLTGAITSRVFAARRLGGSDASDDLSLPNEIEFSMSANVGITFREDIGPRTRRISLAYFDEDPNQRRFRHTDLHSEVRKNRGRILGAIRALVREWIEQRCPEGPTPFTSFPEWSRVVGGIMHANGLGDPCLPHATELALGGDLKERAMRVVFALGFGKWPGAWVTKDALFRLLAATDDEDIGFFGPWTGEDLKATRKKVGMALTAYNNRVLSGVRLEIDPAGKGSQQKVRFTGVEGGSGPRSGNLGNLGNLITCSGSDQINSTVKPNGKPDCSTYAAADNVSKVSGVSDTPVLVTDPGEFDTIARQIATVGVVALDIETYGLEKADALDPRRGRIRLLQLAIPGRAPWVIDMRATGTDLGMLKHVLEPSVLIIHNARFDLGFLHEACGFQARRVFCTWTASKLLTNGTRDPNDLFAVLDRHLGISAYEDHSASDWGAVELDESQLRYAASDVVHLHALKEVLERELHTNDLMQVAELEMSLIPVVVDIEAAGLPLDMEELEKSRTQAADEADEARTALRVIAANPGLNPNSPKQVMDALTALGLNLPDTSAETLAPVADNLFVAALLKFRKRSKLAGMLRDLAAQRGANGRVHANFKPLGTETGRFSASNPNLQNIPRGSIRHMVRPPQGMVFVKADYSQIDLRAAAALAGEQEMLKAFREGQDLHRLTASRVTGKPLDQITREERQEAKAVNFGFIYAQGAEGFRKKARADYGLDLTSERASDLRQSFFNSYPAFAEWHDQTRYDADLGLDEIRTRTGRRRLLPPELGAWDRFARAVNSPVQGVAADGMKMALVELHRRLPEGARIILTVHDDVLVECPTAIGEDVKRLVEEVMRAEMGRLLPEVPIEADAEVLDRWK